MLHALYDTYRIKETLSSQLYSVAGIESGRVVSGRVIGISGEVASVGIMSC